MGGDEALGAGAQLLGAGDQIGLMRLEEGERGAEHRRVARTRTQVGRRQPGRVEQPVRAVGLGQRPDERAKGERVRIVGVCVGAGLHVGRTRAVEGSDTRVAKRVLVVEDNELNLKLFCDLLRAHEHLAEPVRDGRLAVARARDFGPDLIITDIQLPYVTGLELIEQFKADAALHAVPIMAVTAYAGRGDEERIRAAGAEAYVSKPISVARFMDTVDGLFAERAVAQSIGTPATGA